VKGSKRNTSLKARVEMRQVGTIAYLLRQFYQNVSRWPRSKRVTDGAEIIFTVTLLWMYIPIDQCYFIHCRNALVISPKQRTPLRRKLYTGCSAVNGSEINHCIASAIKCVGEVDTSPNTGPHKVPYMLSRFQHGHDTHQDDIQFLDRYYW